MITEKIDRIQVQRVGTLINNAQRIAVISHISPDGDAMGSSHGLMHWLRSIGKTAQVILPNAAPDFLMWLPGVETTILYDKQPDEAAAWLNTADLIICTDFNEPKRIGALGELILSANATKVVIDHHLITATAPVDYAAVLMSYPDSPSACELVYRLIRRLDGQINLDAAICIYTGMMTDTGNFSFNSNYPEMYEIVGHLVALGVDKDAIYNRVFNAWTADRMKLVGFCLNNKMRLYPDHHTALIYISGKELYKFHFKSGDSEGIVNMPLQIKDVYYSVFMREDKDKIKISMRSQGDRPVNVFCHEVFNGGGHKNASGGEHYGTLPEAVRLFLDNYEKYFIKS